MRGKPNYKLNAAPPFNFKNHATMQLKIKLHKGGKMPQKMSGNAAGHDCFANLETFEGSAVVAHNKGVKCVYLAPGETLLIPLGFSLEVPPSFWAGLYGRSGHASKHKVSLGNGVGVGDSDYRGEYKAILHNAHRYDHFPIVHGDRIAQLILHPCVHFELSEGVLSETQRGGGGFGSTGN